MFRYFLRVSPDQLVPMARLASVAVAVYLLAAALAAPLAGEWGGPGNSTANISNFGHIHHSFLKVKLFRRVQNILTMKHFCIGQKNCSAELKLQVIVHVAINYKKKKTLRYCKGQWYTICLVIVLHYIMLYFFNYNSYCFTNLISSGLTDAVVNQWLTLELISSWLKFINDER